ncbi:MAG: TonB-dependent receptor [Bacteroidota bacterium]|nr:TonB-dependent receptor [Bacteroidota bacterium]MDP4204674.1 TonB-dependent receptor [Bacteroidota bacterium]
MKKNLQKLFLLLLLLVITGVVEAQKITVKGKVIDQATNSSMPGVNVAIKGKPIGTITDADGKYSLSVQKGEVLVYSFIGYKSLERPATKDLIDVALSEEKRDIDEVVVIGYGTAKKKDLTGSISVVNMKDVAKVATNDITKAMQGQVAGVQVHGSGEPGAAPQVKIRGVGSFGNSTPLYIIDGIVSPINDFPISEVETMQVLKDASACAIYGSRAANGVVIITTKRGKSGKMKVDYNAYYGIQNVANRYDVCNTQQYQMLVNEASVNAGVALVPGNDPSSPSYISNVNTNWQSEVLKTGKIQEHNINVSGGAENSNYNVLLNYFDQSGTVQGPAPHYTRYSFSVNSDHKRGKFKFGESLLYSRADQKFMTFLHDGNMLLDMVKAIPTMPIYDSNRLGGYGGADNQIQKAITLNVIGVNNLLKSTTQRFRFLGNAYGEYEFIPGLNYRASLSYERVDYRDFNFIPEYDLGWFFQNSVSKMNDNRGNGNTLTFEQTLTYDKTFGKHKFTAMIGNTDLDAHNSVLNGHAENFSKPYFYELSQGTSGISATSYEAQSRLLSYFGRLNYSYDDKYLLTATIRRDGSSRFGKDYRWGNFPSVALTWKMHNEEFIKNLPFISQMKLRTSYGELGNMEIGDYRYSAYINPYAHAVFNNVLAPGSTQVEFGTPDVHWESKKSANVGLDLGFLQDKFFLTAEYYNNRISDMLVQVPIPESTGVYSWKSPWINGASMRNTGFEFEFGYRKVDGDFHYTIKGNISTLKNKVLSLGYGDNPIYGNGSRTAVGSSVGEFYGFVIDKMFQNKSEIDQLNAASPTGIYQNILTSPGDYKFKDINGRDANGKLTGKPDGKIDDDDRTYLGSAIPNLTFGLNFSASYKDFDFTFVANGVSGNKVFNAIRVSLENGAGYDNYSTRMLDRWTPQNTNTDIPRVVMYDPNNNSRFSARWLEDGKYLKISNIQLGYTLPKTLTDKVNISSLRVYLSGQNVYTFTKYTGFDPDFGNDGLFDRGVDHASAPNKAFNAYSGGLPNPRTFLLGVQLGF